MTANIMRYFKHIFAGSERIATKRGEGFSVNLPAESNEVENDQGFDWMNELERQAMWFNPQADIVNPDAHPGVIRNYAHKLGLNTSIDMLSIDIQFPSLYRVSSLRSHPAIYFYHTDITGNTGYLSVTLRDQSGLVTGTRVVQHYQYMPFGEVFVHQNTQLHHNPYDFRAKEGDVEMRSILAYHKVKIGKHAKTGFHYFGARFYHASWGIFLSPDPLASFAPPLTPYRYAFNNPIRYHDPSGLIEVEKDGGDNSRDLGGDPKKPIKYAYLAVSLGQKHFQFRAENMQIFRKQVQAIKSHTGNATQVVSVIENAVGYEEPKLNPLLPVVLQYTKNIPNKEILFLAIFGQGQGSIWGDGGFIGKTELANALSNSKEKGNIAFHRDAIIYMGTCNSGTDYGGSFAQELANVLEVGVIAMKNDGVAPTGDERTPKTMTYGPKMGDKYNGKFYLFRKGKDPVLIGK